MLRALCEYHKLSIAKDPEIHAMTKRTEINEVLSELQDNLPCTRAAAAIAVASKTSEAIHSLRGGKAC
jgi:hypothetical protein